MYKIESIRYVELASIFSLIFIFLLYFYYYKLIYQNKYIKYLLLGLRLICFIALIVLLLDPTFKAIKQSEDFKHLSIYIDNSRSIINNNSFTNFNDYIKKFLNSLKSNQFHYDVYTFGDSLRNIDKNIDLLDFKDNITEISQVYSHINSNNYESIIISDGNINTGNKNISINRRNIVNVFSIGNENSVSVDDIVLKTINISDAKINNDSIMINVMIESSLSNDYDNIDIFFSNDNINYNTIDKINLVSGSNILSSKEIKIDKNMLSTLNFVKVDHVKNENINNNINTFSLDRNSLNKHNILLITGSLSSNTVIIKSILNTILGDSYNHIYKINDFNWSENFDNYNQIIYDAIIFDNFPLNDDDLDIIDNFTSIDSKMIYFQGPNTNIFQEKKYLNKYGYKRKDVKTAEFNLLNKNLSSTLASILKNFPPYSFNSIITASTGNDERLIMKESSNLETIVIDRFEEELFVFLPNLLEFEAFSKINNHSFIKVFDYYFDNFLNENSNDFEIQTLYSKYNLNEEFEVMVKSKIPIEDISKLTLFINNQNSTKSVLIDNYEINDNVITFKESINDINEHQIFVTLTKTDLSEISTNSKTLNINTLSVESQIFPKNEEYLKLIASKTNGKYDNIENIETLLNSYTKNNNKSYKKIIRSNIFMFQKYWFLIIIFLLIEWYIRKNRGLI